MAIEPNETTISDSHLPSEASAHTAEAGLTDGASATANSDVSSQGSAEHAGVFEEIKRLQQNQGSWGGFVLILAASMLLFVGAGSPGNSWDMAYILVPILLVHELGHYLAMRLFRYRNVKMFFIPLLGAAVSGQNYNVPGWKKAIVSLMGPLPGILLGAVLGTTGLLLGKAILVKIAILALILNGFNLLPVLPLDGGWILHAILFSRHHLLDVTFRVVAAGALIAGGVFGKDKVLMYMGIFMLLGAPMAYVLGRIAAELRQAGLSPVSSDNQTIPHDVAVTIIGKVKKVCPKNVKDKTVAQHTLHVFETLNARPPGWLASLAFAAVHGVGLVIAVLFLILFTIAQNGGLRDFAIAAAMAPKHTLVPDARSQYEGPEASASAQRNTIVATFSRVADARKTFEDLKPRMPANGSLQLFGQSVLLALPAADDAARQQWFQELQKRSADTFVDCEGAAATFSLVCFAPNKAAAEAIEQEAEEYLRNPSDWHLIPPWLVTDDRTPQQQAQHRLARQMYLKILNADAKRYEHPAVRDLDKQMAQAQRQGDRKEVERLQTEQKKLFIDLRSQSVRQLQQAGEGNLDTALIDQYLTLIAQEEGFVKNGAQQLVPRLGQLPVVNGQVKPGADRYSARFGMVQRNGVMLNFRWMSFKQVSEGPPALIDWLVSKGCSRMKYEFQMASSPSESDE